MFKILFSFLSSYKYNVVGYPDVEIENETYFEIQNTGRKGCLKLKPKQNQVNKFELYELNCDEASRFFCVIDGLKKVVSPNPSLSQFPCFENPVSRKKRQVVTCPTGYVKNIWAECFKFVTTAKGMLQSQQHCTAEDSQATLMFFSVGNRFVTLYDNLKAGSVPGFVFGTSVFWLEAQKDPIDGKFKYLVDGLPTLPDPTFMKDQTAGKTGECLIAKPDPLDNYKFFIDAVDCSLPKTFLCVTGIATVTNPPTTTPAPTPASPVPVLPTFPCFESPSGVRKKRQTESSASLEKLNLLLDPSKETSRQVKLTEAREAYNASFGQADLQKAYESLFEILWYSQLPCYDVKNVTSDAKDQMSIIKRCHWKGQEISCPIIFKTLPTDRGMCCSFNMERAEEIFKKSKYADAVEKMQEKDHQNR